jgi:hypothetical protein
MTTITSRSSLPAKLSGVNSVTLPVCAMPSKNWGTSALPCLMPGRRST